MTRVAATGEPFVVVTIRKAGDLNADKIIIQLCSCTCRRENIKGNNNKLAMQEEQENEGGGRGAGGAGGRGGDAPIGSAMQQKGLGGSASRKFKRETRRARKLVKIVSLGSSEGPS